MARGKKVEPIKIETTVGEAVGTAYMLIEELAGEMREAYDNTPESLQNGGVGEARGEAADTLENISEPTCDNETVNELKATFELMPSRKRHGPSRADRRDEATRYAQEAIDTLQAFLEEHEEGDAHDDAEAFADEIQSLIDEVEGVEFPGMFG